MSFHHFLFVFCFVFYVYIVKKKIIKRICIVKHIQFGFKNRYFSICWQDCFTPPRSVESCVIFRTVLFNKDVVNVFLKTDMTLGAAVIHSVSLCTCARVCVRACTHIHTHPRAHTGVFLAIPSIDSVPILPLG